MFKKISNQFMINFLVMFLFALLSVFLAFALLGLASNLISGNLAKNRFPASEVAKPNYRDIEVDDVVSNGGGIQVIDDQYRLVLNAGINSFGQNQLTKESFTTFLINSEKGNFHYDIRYVPEGDYWLIVTFPTSFRIDFGIASNEKASLEDVVVVQKIVAMVAVFFLLCIALITYIYSRIASASIIVPLRKLNNGTKLIKEGDYTARVALHLKNEFLEIQETFNEMASKIELEIALRKKSEEDRKQLILDISHDLKNPMFSIQGFAELCLNKDSLTEQERKDYLQRIIISSQRANTLLNDLFELSCMERPEFMLQKTEEDICEVMRCIGSEYIPQLELKGFQYEFDIPDQTCKVAVDVPRFSRIWHNIIDNAMRYNDSGTIVKLEVMKEDQQIVIRFSDNGCGIPNSMSEDVFKSFVRVDNTRNSSTGGSGLGLAIAKKIAMLHQAELTLVKDHHPGCMFVMKINHI